MAVVTTVTGLSIVPVPGLDDSTAQVLHQRLQWPQRYVYHGDLPEAVNMAEKVTDREIFLRAKAGDLKTSYQQGRMAELLTEAVDLAYLGVGDPSQQLQLNRLREIIHGPELLDRPVRTDCLDCPTG